MTAEPEAPSSFIIWTLQRTGGTNLANKLMVASQCLERARMGSRPPESSRWLGQIKDAWDLHEPFNMGSHARAFGEVSQQWHDTQDIARLEEQIAAICALKLPIKHCVEMAPWPVSEALARIATEAGYRHLFLYRENPLDRLLSLHYAQKSGKWGSYSRPTATDEAEIFQEQLPVGALLKHETFCNQMLSRAWSVIHLAGGSPLAISFEEIYDKKRPQLAKLKIAELFNELNLNSDEPAIAQTIHELIQYGNQGTRESYSRFKGIGLLRQGLLSVKRPEFIHDVYTLSLKPVWQETGNFIFADIDIFPATTAPEKPFDISGVVTYKAPFPGPVSIHAKRRNKGWEGRMGLHSPSIAARYPEAANREHARFRIQGIRCKRNLPIVIALQNADQEYPLFRINLHHKNS